VRVRVVGSGADLPRVTALAAALEAPVEVCGSTPRAGMSAHYAWADSVLVSLRPWPALSLTVPSKLYEAMALGVHVSGSVSGEAAQIIEDTGAGHVARAGDAEALASTWQALAQSPELLEPAPKARDWVAEHADDRRLGEAYLGLIHEVVARHGR
jgi:glycosyltransferase involved in cell wall biosynthesis